MKKYIVVILVVVVGLELLLVPYFKSDNPNEIIKPAPAVIGEMDSTNILEGKVTEITIELKEKDLALVELLYNSKVVESWKNPKSTIKFGLTPDQPGIYMVQVRSTDKDGKIYTDGKRVEVWSSLVPEILKAEIKNTYNHNVSSYTQGLEFYKGRLFEGTGQYGQSRISEVNLETGEVIRSLGLDGTYFGEGITIFEGTLYQLTWKKGKCFTYYIEDSLQILDDLSYIGQDGWGLTNDGSLLIMSDGTNRLTFRNPETFQTVKTIDVYNNLGPMNYLNELEYVDGKIYANVYQTNLIVVIDPETGRIIQEIDCTDLEKAGRNGGDVLNGVAYNHQTGKMYLTGKYWKHLFEVEFVKRSDNL